MIIFTNNVAQALDQLLAPSISMFVLTDSNTSKLVLPRLRKESAVLAAAKEIVIPAGDDNKNTDSLMHVWRELTNNGATRSSMLINLGGGVVTDLGGFAAATFKRGIKFVNIPTTLLSAVDAAVGGKTGINFNGYKNEIGAFKEAEHVIISTAFLSTLPKEEILSGYAEMLKHGVLDGWDTLAELFDFDFDYDYDYDYDSDSEPSEMSELSEPSEPSRASQGKLLGLLEKSVGVKKAIVEADPTEKGLRKALNLGHTIGHAFESFAMADRKKPIPHGYAVAWGLVCELILSSLKTGFPSGTLHQIITYIKENYGSYPIDCKDYPRLLEIMSHDKKNARPDAINFTLMADVGKPLINQVATPDEIKEALDIFNAEG